MNKSSSKMNGMKIFGLLMQGVLVMSGVAHTPTNWGQSRTVDTSKASGENDSRRAEQAKAWMARSLEAQGGSDRLTALTDLSFSSEAAVEGGQPARYKVYFKGADKFRSEVSGANYFAMTIANGPSAWLKSDATLIELVAGDVESLKLSTLLQSQPHMVFGLLAKFWDAGDRAVDGTSYHILGASGFLGANFIRGEVSIDPKTYLIRRFEYEEEVETKQGRGIKKYDLWFESYQLVAGIQFPTKEISIQSGVKSIIALGDFKVNSNLPDGFFDKPK